MDGFWFLCEIESLEILRELKERGVARPRFYKEGKSYDAIASILRSYGLVVNFTTSPGGKRLLLAALPPQ